MDVPVPGSAYVLFAKYGLHLPLNRQSDVYQREGIDLDVSTLADWVGAAALMPLVDAIRSHVFAADPCQRCLALILIASARFRATRLFHI